MLNLGINSKTATQSSAASAGPIHIPTSHSDCTLSIFLRMICALGIPTWASFDQVWDVLLLCESWDAPGPISTIRTGMTAPLFLSQPLKLYRIAMQFGWESEAKLASTRSLKLNLFSEENKEELSLLSGAALWKLMALHKSRRDLFKKMLDDGELFNSGNSTICYHCHKAVDHHTWRELKHRLFCELDKDASGKEILVGLHEWPEAVACWEFQCPSCKEFSHTKSSTIENLESSLSSLPTTV
ncbi:hypothetical protein D9758_011749 [Tetrapyrgos nigripes]|uniref:Uncharacterized protein n=1 Tax=Tetrapyrgos nigripes TaxID=182062 RepID=A0A8H5FUK6_9AGAR|nr:hypothetical protein D9758_011749 [Tetrapyrgos nigripes]